MYKSIILPAAKADLKEAALWYNKQQSGLGKRFLEEVEHIVHFISRNPKASIIRYDKVRTAVLNLFPFMIHFTVDETNKTVLVVAVLHTSRKPRF